MKGSPAPMLRLFVEPERWNISGKGALLRWLEGELLREGGEGLIHLVLVDDEQIAELNEEHLGHEGATDVISFDLQGELEVPMHTPDGFLEPEKAGLDGGFPDGEVYVSLDRAADQARQYGVSPTEEVSRLALHGLLHLAGWDDQSEPERIAMSAREDEGLERARGNGEFSWSVQPPEQEV